MKGAIGIDIGGTFTHAVAIDTRSFSLVTQTKTSTTHHSQEGVARGIVTALKKLLRKGKIKPEEIVLVAHSTTQTTGALLEGDVAKVGIIGMGAGLKAMRVRRETNIDNIELTPGKVLRTCYRYLDTGKNFTDRAIRRTLSELGQEGAEAIVAAEAFSVDMPAREQRVVAMAKEMGLPATASQQISQLYGLRIRTRTAVINASVLPVMIKTAEITQRSLRQAGITAPLMVMRSDGGIMDIEGMRERPILTMLSGPAAGVAAALLYGRVSEGIFVDVGGTSTDLCAIHHGEVMVRTARIGKHRLHLRTLDVRTLGVAGGSMPRIRNGEIVDVGPRSAHIAGMPYEAFSLLDDLDGAEPTIGSPVADDSSEYVFLQKPNKKIAITVTGAANHLDWIPKYDCARGGERNVGLAFDILGKWLGKSSTEVAEAVLDRACGKIASAVHELVEDYQLDLGSVRLIGGGGGASTIVPKVAKMVGVPYEIAPNNAVLSAIGVALAMVRETIERGIVQPTENDLLKIRQDAETAVLRMGAAPGTVEVKIEVDSQRNRVRAIAAGSIEPRLIERIGRPVSAEQQSSIAAAALGVEAGEVRMLAQNGYFAVFTTAKIVPRLFGVIKQKVEPVVIVDQLGVVRRSFKNASLRRMRAGDGKEKLQRFVDAFTQYGDSGSQIPVIHLAIGPRLVDCSGLATAEQIVSVGMHELSKSAAETPVLLLAERRN